MSTAELTAKIKYDGKDFSTGVDGANKKVHGFGLTLQGLQRAMGIGLATAIVTKFFSAMQDVIKLADEGIVLVKPEELESMKTATKYAENFFDTVKVGAAKAGSVLFGGLGVFGKVMKEMGHGLTWKEAWGVASQPVKGHTELKKEVEDKKKAGQEAIKNTEAEYEAKFKFQQAADALEEKALKDKEQRDAEGQEEWLMREQERYEAKKKFDEETEEHYEKDWRTAADAQRKIAELTGIEPKDVSVRPSSGASLGMYMGGKDRSGVGIASHQLNVQLKIAAILDEMRRDISGEIY